MTSDGAGAIKNTISKNRGWPFGNGVHAHLFALLLHSFESDGIRVPSTSAEIRCIHGVRRSPVRDFGQHVQMKQWHHFIFHVDGYVGLDQSGYRVPKVTRECGAVGGRSEICRWTHGYRHLFIFNGPSEEKNKNKCARAHSSDFFEKFSSEMVRHFEASRTNGCGHGRFCFPRKPAQLSSSRTLKFENDEKKKKKNKQTSSSAFPMNGLLVETRIFLTGLFLIWAVRSIERTKRKIRNEGQKNNKDKKN